MEEMVQDKRGLATYGQIKDYVLECSGLKVSSLYIAQVKQKHGIIERENYNKSKSETAKQPQCPPERVCQVFCVSYKKKFIGEGEPPLLYHRTLLRVTSLKRPVNKTTYHYTT